MSTSNRCKRCKSSVQIGLKCIKCGVVSHKSCLNALKGVTFFDDATVNCCPEAPVDIVLAGTASKQDKSAHIPVNPADSACGNSEFKMQEIKIKHLEELLEQKESIILYQSIAINSLQDQVAYLKDQLKSQEINPIGNIAVGGVTNQAVLTSSNQNKNKNKNKSASPPAPIISSAAVSHSIHLAQAQKVCKDIINLNKDSQNDHDIPGQNVCQDVMQRRAAQMPRRKSRNILVGDGKNMPDNNVLKSAKYNEYKHFHSTYWDPETDEGALSDYLRRFVPEVQIEKLNSRNPSRYASFKVSVPNMEAHKITRPEIWPSGVLLNQFFRANTSADNRVD